MNEGSYMTQAAKDACDEINKNAAERQSELNREIEFTNAWNGVQKEFHELMVSKGFWDGGIEARNIGEMCMLMVTELAEAFEGYRRHNKPDEHCPEFSSLEVELADMISRIMDMAGGRGLRVPEALFAKHPYNKNRPSKNGKRC